MSAPIAGSSSETFWRKCSSCKKPMNFGQRYWVCSVSTCNRARTGLIFCDVRCFDAHVPMMNHRDAGAFERTAPTEKQFKEQKAEEGQKLEKQARPVEATKTRSSDQAGQAGQTGLADDDILVVVSKIKAYIRARSGMNTSESVMEVLSDRVRSYSDQAIQSANANGMKTVLDRDFLSVGRPPTRL